jgi:hypothetical protein
VIINSPVPETDESSIPVAELKSTPKPTVKNNDTDTPANTNLAATEAEESREPAESKGQEQPDGREEMEERNIGDLPGATISDADRLLNKVYGDYVHQNPGTHLDGGIADDALWQERWSRLTVYPSK